MKLLTGNDLASGAVTWWTGNGWSIHVEDAADVGESGDAIVADIRAGFTRPEAVRFERDRGRAIASAIAMASPADVVLIAGKGHEPYQEIDGVRYPFDDLRIAAAALTEAA